MHHFRGTLQWKSEKCYFYKRESIGSIAFSEATYKHSHWRVTMQYQPDKWHFFKKRLIVRFGVYCVSRISKLSNSAPQSRHANTLHSSGWRLVTIWSWVFFRRDPFILMTIDQNNDQPWSLFTFGYYLHQFLYSNVDLACGSLHCRIFSSFGLCRGQKSGGRSLTEWPFPVHSSAFLGIFNFVRIMIERQNQQNPHRFFKLAQHRSRSASVFWSTSSKDIDSIF